MVIECRGVWRYLRDKMTDEACAFCVKFELENTHVW